MCGAASLMMFVSLVDVVCFLRVVMYVCCWCLFLCVLLFDVLFGIVLLFVCVCCFVLLLVVSVL